LSKVSGFGFEPLEEAALDAVEAEFVRFQTPVRIPSPESRIPNPESRYLTPPAFWMRWSSTAIRLVCDGSVARSAVSPAV
jgi:hypothetical protein